MIDELENVNAEKKKSRKSKQDENVCNYIY